MTGRPVVYTGGADLKLVSSSNRGLNNVSSSAEGLDFFFVIGGVSLGLLKGLVFLSKFLEVVIVSL